MSEQKHVLYAIELTDQVDELVKKVITEVKKSGAKITVYNALKGVVGALDAGAVYIPGQALLDIEKEMVEQAHQQIKTLANETGLSEDDIVVEVHVEPRQAILEKAKELKVDKIILNGHHHSLFGRLGSTADAIINKADCTVTIVRENKYK